LTHFDVLLTGCHTSILH